MGTYRVETDKAIIEMVPPSVVLGRKQTEEEKQVVLDDIADISYKIAKRLWEEGKLSTL